ncbi:MAG: hypothetical protein RLZZ34_2341 [Verrucomicrobiota bacterium]|jgi:predicted Zn-dependent protease
MEELGLPDRHHALAAEGWLGLGDTDEAERELGRLSPEGARHPAALEVEWRIHSERKAWNKALRTARRLVEVTPDLPSGWIHQSYSLHELRRTEEALQLLQTVVSRFPGESVIPYNLACYACQLGEMDAARRWLVQAVQVGGKPLIRRMAEDDPDLVPLRGFLQKL